METLQTSAEPCSVYRKIRVIDANSMTYFEFETETTYTVDPQDPTHIVLHLMFSYLRDESSTVVIPFSSVIFSVSCAECTYTPAARSVINNAYNQTFTILATDYEVVFERDFHTTVPVDELLPCVSSVEFSTRGYWVYSAPYYITPSLEDLNDYYDP